MWSKTYGSDHNFDQFAPNRGLPLAPNFYLFAPGDRPKNSTRYPPLTDLGNTRLDSQKSTTQEPSAGIDWLDFRGLLDPQKIVELFDRLLTGLRSVRGGIYAYELSEGAAEVWIPSALKSFTKKVGITNAKKDCQI